MPAETLNCPMCGAATTTEMPRCEHCGARLATVACPSCFGMMFQGAKFCPRCGARAERAEVDDAKHLQCPRCQTGMESVTVGGTMLRECPKCEGLWVDADSLEHICAERERQAAVLGMAQPARAPVSGAIEEKVRYLPCPECRKLMNRVNFAGYSNVIVDVCKSHGTWFDRDELRRVVEFIKSGGLDTARRRELDELEARQQHLKSAQTAATWDPSMPDQESPCARHSGISLIAEALSSMFRD
jgi:Zn-finger nucleic acid-binding protein